MRDSLPLADCLELMVPPLPWDRPRRRERGGPRVVLLHGLWRSRRSMEPLARRLHREGFATLNLAYPSTRLAVPDILRRVRPWIEDFARGGTVHFVTHSLGGIVVRALCAESQPWDCGRIVMLAPPNGGSEIVEWARAHRLIHHLLGPAGRELGRDGLPTRLPPPPAPERIAVVMGCHSRIPFFRKILDPRNDGIVSAPNGGLPGVAHFAEIDADHTFIAIHPDAVSRILAFLRDGRWPDDAGLATTAPD